MEKTSATSRQLHMLVSDVVRCSRCCCCCRSSPLPFLAVSGSEEGRCDGEFVCDAKGGRLNPIIEFDKFGARAGPESESESESESDQVLRVASRALLPNKRLNMLGFVVTVGIDVGTGTSGGGVTSEDDWM
jgi:hypothetical protein